jgi:hypothetical protein
MLVYGVLDPDALDPERLEDLAYRNQVVLLLDGLRRNSRLVVDKDVLRQKIYQSIYEFIRSSTKLSQKIGVLVTEAGKQGWLIKVESEAFRRRWKRSKNLLSAAQELVEDCGADTLLTTKEGRALLREPGKATEMEEYQFSEFEEERQRFLRKLPIDGKSDAQLEEVIRRVVKYSRWLKLYDKYIGRKDGEDRFYRGIYYVLDLWRRNCCVGNEMSGVEIFTCACSSGLGTPSSGRRACEVLLKRLRGEFDFGIKFRLAEGNARGFHARYLRSESAIVWFDKGFDLFSSDGQIERTSLQFTGEETMSELQEWENAAKAVDM